jgi:oligo-1,6-glucosidase
LLRPACSFSGPYQWPAPSLTIRLPCNLHHYCISLDIYLPHIFSPTWVKSSRWVLQSIVGGRRPSSTKYADCQCSNTLTSSNSPLKVYPASFQSTGSGSLPGWGDIKGVISKLDYFKHLGVDVVWLSPIYKSPQVDMGYDIADYKDIDPRYGTLEDVDELIAGLHKRDMKLMMDLVVNHTSDQHDWFIKSRSSKDDPKRSWYHWQPPKYDEHGNRQPPNNWAMILGEAHSAWTWDEKTQEYYLALFTPEQPDLNWENPDVRAAVHDVLHFWLKRGTSGFRMDVINHISKTPGYPDAPITSPGSKYQPGYKYYANGPRLHEWLQAMNREVLSKYDTITVGEMPFVRSEDEILKVVGAKRGELNMIFIFEMVDIDNDETGFRLTLRDWNTNEIKKIFNKWQTLMIERNGWNSLFIENHGKTP